MKKTMLPLRPFSLHTISVTDPWRKNAMEKELAYLLQLEPARLLAGFYETAGKSVPAPKYAGWESTELRGHTLGHYLTAVSQGWAVTGRQELLERVETLVQGLEECQRADGYLAAFPEALFDNVEQNRPAWVPWYTMHKILAGLLAAYQLAGSKRALRLAARLGDWVAARTACWTPEVQRRVLAVEYGGMNEALYQLFTYTHQAEHSAAAHAFDELPLFTATADGQDVLGGLHANTTIPKFLGALARYRLTGEILYLHAAQNFWSEVVHHHSYASGGNSESEHFAAPDVLDAKRTNQNCETCNSYNMLRLTRELFLLTGEKKYADFYAHTLQNSILASQNPETGMTTYFQPMDSGYFKVFATPFDRFWCCTGTGMENFTKLGSSIYFAAHNDSAVCVNQYVSSVLHLCSGVQLEQQAELPESDTVRFRVSTQGGTLAADLLLRQPDWLAGPMAVQRNGQPCEAAVESGYLRLAGPWCDGDTLLVTLPMQVRAEALPDAPHTVAFSYGPVLLAAVLNSDNMETEMVGVLVSVPARHRAVKDYLALRQDTPERFCAEVSKHFRRLEGTALAFTLCGTDEDDRLVFIPYYRQYKQCYGIYWYLAQAGSSELRELTERKKMTAACANTVVDRVAVGNDQYELQHMVHGEKTEAATVDGERCRRAAAQGWFCYRMRVQPKGQNALLVWYRNGLEQGSATVSVDGIPLAQERPKADEIPFVYSRQYSLPQKLTAGKTEVEVRFDAGKTGFGGIFGQLQILREQ